MLEILGSPGKEKTKEINMLDFPLLKKIGFSETLKECLETGETKRIETEYESKWGKQSTRGFIFHPYRKTVQSRGLR